MMQRSLIQAKRQRCSGRRGSFLIEAGAAVMMLTIAMTLTVKVVGWVALEHRANDRRQQALSEAANLMERLLAIPYEQCTPESIKHLTLSPQGKSTLPGPELTLAVIEDDSIGGKGSKKLSLAIRWRNRAGEWDSPVHLTSWIYRSVQE